MAGPKKKQQSQPGFDDRTRLVLLAIIDNYIQTSEPVGSRTLSKSLEVVLSPATIRNIMSDLSDMGFLMQMHTSAGRIPTDKAYRFYVNSLKSDIDIPELIKAKISEVSKQQNFPIEELLLETTHVLAELTHFACVVTTPKTAVSRLQRVEFIKVSRTRVLVILVTKSGVVRNKVIMIKEDTSQEFLNSVSAFLNREFENHSMKEIRKKILQSIVDERNRYDELLAQAVRLGKKAFELNQPGEIFIDGQMNLLLDSRFHEQAAARTLINAFDKKSAIMEILDNTMNKENGHHIFIGVENDFEYFHDCTMITASYGNNQHVLGTLAIVGPTSMDYQTIIPVVDYAAKILSQTITEQSYD